MYLVSFQNLKNDGSVEKCAEAEEPGKIKQECDTYILKYLKHFNEKGGAYFKRDDMAFKLAMGATVTGEGVADYSQTSAIYNDVQI